MKLKKMLFGTAFVFSSLSSQIGLAQQLKGWHMAPNLIDFQPATPSVKPAFTTNGATPGANSIYDSEGKLLFYIANFDKVYNKFDQVIGTLSTPYTGVSEIAIVPSPDNSSCSNRYFIIYPKIGTCCGNGSLIYGEVNMNANFGLGQYISNPNPPFGTVGSIASPLSVSKVVSGKRYIYYVTASGVINMNEITSSGVSSTATALTGMLAANLFGIELELSNTGDKIAFSSGTSGSIEVLPLNPATGLASGAPSYVFTTGGGNNIKGLEFDNTGNKLFYSVSGSGVFVKQLVSPFSLTTITTSFNNSMLEKIYGGSKILCGDASNVLTIDATSYALGTTVAYTLPQLALSSNAILMPDQIDGENYDATGTINVDVDIYNATTSATWNVSTNPFFALQQNSYLGTLTSFSKVRVATSINIPNAISINMDKMTFEFHTNAELNVNGGGNLTSTGTLMQGHPCGLMWRGISVNNNNVTNASNFTMINSGLNLPIIYDAIRGVEVNGANVTTSLTNALFNKNEKSVVLNSVTPSLTNIKSSFFYATLPLKDQTKGQVLTTSGTTKHGITGIEANTSGTSINKLLLGSATAGQGNYFESGQYGIRSFRTDVSIQNNTFNNVDRTAISADANFMGTRETDVVSNTFTNNNTDVWAVFNCNLTAQKNTSTGCKQFCMRWHYNYGNKLTIGDVNNNTLGNTFTGYMWAGVAVSDCDNASTKIEIERNTFQNAPWAGGVLLSEATLTSGLRTYDYYWIRNNTFNNVQGAVNVVNVKGSNSTDNDWNGDQNNFSTNFDINHNTINFATNYNVSAVGIKVENSPKNRAFSNQVTSDNSGNWQNAGISFGSSPNCLIKGNVVQAGFAMRFGLDMMGSNILCNTLKYSVVGIEPNWSWLRSTNVDHGDAVHGRQNTFISNGTDIKVSYCYDVNYKWVNPNHTLPILYVPGTAPYGTNIISTTIGAGPCTTTVSGRMAGGNADGSSDYDVATNDDVPANYSDEVQIAQQNNAEFFQKIEGIKSNSHHKTILDNLDALAQAQINYNNGDWQNTKTQLDNVSKNKSLVELNLHTVLNILNTLRLENRFEYTDSEKATLEAIAQSDARTGGQGVYYARGILLTAYNMHFEDPYFSHQNASSNKRIKIKTDAIQELSSIVVYPNPVINHVNVQLPDSETQLIIYNNQGIQVYNQKHKGHTKINTSNWPAGIYLMEILDSGTNKKEKHKFIVE